MYNYIQALPLRRGRISRASRKGTLGFVTAHVWLLHAIKGRSER